MKSLLIKLGVILGALIIFGFAEVWGADWKLFAETDLYECFYDAEDIAPSSKNIVDVWAKLEYTKKGITGVVKQFGKHYSDLSYSLELLEFNCTEKRERLLSITEYSVEGKILYANSVKDRLPAWKTIPRDSVESSLYQAVCK
ncbi:MAG TPA: surface-adhesin E family protein [Thermodesulfobacteriota bacterium]|nr:surface-adhesin E family protein [Thermodesulfobacteriota bacterium]